MTDYLASRRKFMLQVLVAGAAIPLLGTGSEALAALPRLPPDNPQAKALGYVEDAAKTVNAAHKPGSTCSNCQFFTAATGACALFAGFSVAPKGWCTAWAKKAG